MADHCGTRRSIYALPSPTQSSKSQVWILSSRRLPVLLRGLALPFPLSSLFLRFDSLGLLLSRSNELDRSRLRLPDESCWDRRLNVEEFRRCRSGSTLLSSSSSSSSSSTSISSPRDRCSAETLHSSPVNRRFESLCVRRPGKVVLKPRLVETTRCPTGEAAFEPAGDERSARSSVEVASKVLLVPAMSGFGVMIALLTFSTTAFGMFFRAKVDILCRNGCVSRQ